MLPIYRHSAREVDSPIRFQPGPGASRTRKEPPVHYHLLVNRGRVDTWGKVQVKLNISLLVVFVMIALLAGPVGAAEDPLNAGLTMCDPVTIADLFPVEEEVPEVIMGIRGQTPVPDPNPREPKPKPEPDPDPEPQCRPFVYEMGSPVGQAPAIISGFGADRPNDRKHLGADVAGPKLMPVYAVSDGLVAWLGSECCSLAVKHPDGWSSYYIHLNNDTFGTDDESGWGLAPGIESGVAVTRGQLLGWIGDSGNAEQTVPHVHFELRQPDGTAVDAVPSLRASQSSSTTLALASAVSESVIVEYDAGASFTYPYPDDDGHRFEAAIGQLTALGTLTGCGTPVGSAFCPDGPVYGRDVTAFIQAAFGLGVNAAEEIEYHPLTGTASLAALSTAFDCGIGRYCDDVALTAGEVSQLLAVVASSAPLRTAPSILTLPACEHPLADPAAALTRAEFAAVAAEALGAVTIVSCGTAN